MGRAGRISTPHRSALTDTTTTLRMPARLMATTAPTGLQMAYSSVPVPGSADSDSVVSIVALAASAISTTAVLGGTSMAVLEEASTIVASAEVLIAASAAVELVPASAEAFTTAADSAAVTAFTVEAVSAAEPAAVSTVVAAVASTAAVAEDFTAVEVEAASMAEVVDPTAAADTAKLTGFPGADFLST